MRHCNFGRFRRGTTQSRSLKASEYVNATDTALTNTPIVLPATSAHRWGRDVHSLRAPGGGSRAASSSRLLVPVFAMAR